MHEKGFFARLFDFSFSEFITTSIIKIIFALVVVFSAIAVLMMLVTGFRGGALTGILALILSPLAFLLYVLLGRVWCELIIVVFRIAENTGRLVERQDTPNE